MAAGGAGSSTGNVVVDEPAPSGAVTGCAEESDAGPGAGANQLGTGCADLG